LFYQWDFGDGSVSDWLGPFGSDELCSVSHRWSSSGRYLVRVRAKDNFEDESVWSESLAVEISELRISLKNRVLFLLVVIENVGGYDLHDLKWNFEFEAHGLHGGFLRFPEDVIVGSQDVLTADEVISLRVRVRGCAYFRIGYSYRVEGVVDDGHRYGIVVGPFLLLLWF
jgi:hypothetical protein